MRNISFKVMTMVSGATLNTDSTSGMSRHDSAAMPRSLRELVEWRGADGAGREFITDPETGVCLSFGRYSKAVLQLAAAIRGKGVARGERVVVVLANGLNAAVALLAIMAAGAVAVPVNPKLKEPEIAWLIGNSAARLLITDQHHGASLADPVLDTDFSVADGYQPYNPYRFYPLPRPRSQRGAEENWTEPSWDDPALILYTSGTTGHPKGVILSHGNLLANAGYVCEAHRLTRDDLALCVLPLFHINGLVITLLAPLLSGGRVLMPGRFSAEHFWGWVRDYRATWFSAVPTILSLLLSHGKPAAADIASLRFARSASASLPTAVLESFEGFFGVPVIEAYGISEAAGQVTSNPLPPQAHKPGSAGLAVGNRLAILDDQGRSLPAGQVGEVALKGINIFAGYLDNPGADREALRQGWFHTGDLGYLDPEGYLFLTGRIKEQINRAGEKISPREVEEIIHRLPEVETVGVVGVPHPLYGEEVAAFVTLRPGKSATADRIRSFCQEHLAGFKVPREVFFVDEFPKGPSGKIQRRLLVDLHQRIKKTTGAKLS